MITTEIKTTISNATILGVSGHQEDSITRYSRWLGHMNGKISPVADRVSEHDLSIKLLTSISAAAPHLKLEADKELKAPVGSRVHVYPNGHARAGQRNFSMISAYFDPLWRSQIEGGLAVGTAKCTESIMMKFTAQHYRDAPLGSYSRMPRCTTLRSGIGMLNLPSLDRPWIVKSLSSNPTDLSSLERCANS